MAVPNNSATGGYLIPTSNPVSGELLLDAIQGAIKGMTGLPGSMIRPAFQPDPPKRPTISVNWCGFWVINERPEQGNAFVAKDGAMQRHETFDVRCSFYGPDSAFYAGLLRDGFQISQNRDYLKLEGIAFVGTDTIIPLGEVIDEQYYRRADLTINLRRQIDRKYDILSFLSANGQIHTESQVIPWSVEPPAPPSPADYVMSGPVFVKSGALFVVSGGDQ